MWDTFDFAWGEPGNTSLDDDSEQDDGPGASPMLALEDGGVSDNESDGLPPTQPEQSRDDEGEEDDITSPYFDEQVDDSYGPVSLSQLPNDSPEHEEAFPVNPTLSYELTSGCDGSGNDGPVDPVQEFGDDGIPDDSQKLEEPSNHNEEPPNPPLSSASLSENPSLDSLMPPPPVDPAMLKRKRELAERLEVVRLGGERGGQLKLQTDLAN